MGSSTVQGKSIYLVVQSISFRASLCLGQGLTEYIAQRVSYRATTYMTQTSIEAFNNVYLDFTQHLYYQFGYPELR